MIYIIELQEDFMKGVKPSETVIIPDGFILAGGSVRRWYSGEKQDSDYDLFPVDQGHLQRIVEERFISSSLWKKKYPLRICRRL